MRGILIGAIHKKGTFTDDNGKSIDYDNLVLQVQKPIENKLADDSNFVHGVGYTIANDCKCAWSERGNVFGKDVSMISENLSERKSSISTMIRKSLRL